MRPPSFAACRSARLLIVTLVALAATIAGPASAAALDRGAQPVANPSCGTVLLNGSVPYKVTIEKGSPSCSTVRRILKRFGHPLNKNPRFYCPSKGYECEYSIYPEGWRCGGFFQGNFQCWHGANSPARADEVISGTEDRSSSRLLGKPRESLEFYAEQPGTRYKLQCAIFASLGEAFCTSFPPREGKATVDADGNVVLCRAAQAAENVCLVGNIGEGAPTLKVGRHVNVGMFRCSVLRGGVKCVVRATGKGFVFNSHRARAVGGASVERTGARARPAAADRRRRVKSIGHCGQRLEQIATPVQEETGEIANCQKRPLGIRVFTTE